MSTKSDPGLESGLIWINLDRDAVCGCLPDRSENVVDSLSCRRQSLRQVSCKSTGECMRSGKKSPEITCSAVVKEMEK